LVGVIYAINTIADTSGSLQKRHRVFCTEPLA
jgi:hypothetical protein